jgi:hypothetical protein
MAFTAPSNVIAQTTNAQFQAWITEVVTTLFTTLGVTQTADTGQINPATVAIPGATNTSAGYVIGRFNDALQSTAPIFFKLEFGTATGLSSPGMWITMGTGSNGSGTLTGTVTTRTATGSGSVPTSTTTSFISRYVYLATTQITYLGVCFKIGAQSGTAAGTALAGFQIYRTNDSNGNATANGACLLTGSGNAAFPGGSTANGFGQFISYITNSLIPAAGPTQWWHTIPGNSEVLSLATTIVGGVGQVFNTYTAEPTIRYSAYNGVALQADFAIGTTQTFSIIGSTPITFISAGSPWGGPNGFANLAANIPTFVMPWQ